MKVWEGRRFERDSAMVMGGAMVANASTYLYHVILSRHLGPASYGALGAVLGLAVLPAVPSSGLQFTVARRVATDGEGDGSTAVAAALRLSMLAGLGLAALVLMGAWPLAHFLRTSPAAIAWLAVWLVPLVAAPVLLGALQGRRLFGTFAISAAVLGLGRIVGAAVVSVVGGGVTAAVVVMTVSAALSTAVAARAVRPAIRGVRAAMSPGLVREIGRATAPFVGLAAMAGIDVVLARRFLSPREAGYYVAAAVAGKIVFWAPASIAVVAFPEFASGSDDRHLGRALLAVAAVCAAAVAGILVLREQVIGGLFGSEFLPASDVVFIVAAAMAGLAIVQVLATWGVAHQLPRIGPTLIGGAVLLAALIAASHGSARAIALDLLASSLAMVVLSGEQVVRARRGLRAAS
jgi:O-antigen/teichoic acid export membrane protein